MQPNWEEDKRQMKGQLEGLWRDVEAFAHDGAAAHEVERHLFRKVMSLEFALLMYFLVVPYTRLWPFYVTATS
jgi:hypothetical protein